MIRGEIWWADFGIPFGSEPGFRRPVIIVQDDSFNRSKINTTVVVPFTTNLDLEQAPGNLLIEREESGLTKDSVIVVSQISVIDKKRLTDAVKKINIDIMEKIDEGIRIVLGFSD
jgi:mRNA interferase MazF